jgi:hypothetical protein
MQSLGEEQARLVASRIDGPIEARNRDENLTGRVCAMIYLLRLRVNVDDIAVERCDAMSQQTAEDGLHKSMALSTCHCTGGEVVGSNPTAPSFVKRVKVGV